MAIYKAPEALFWQIMLWRFDYAKWMKKMVILNAGGYMG